MSCRPVNIPKSILPTGSWPWEWLGSVDRMDMDRIVDDPAGAIEWPHGSYFQILHLKQLDPRRLHGLRPDVTWTLVTVRTGRVSHIYIWVSR